MHLILSLLLFFQAAETPFWETKKPAEWSDEQIETLMSQSPWGAPTTIGNTIAFLASARPLREAENELFRRRELNGEVKAEEEDYHAYITQNPGKHIVVAVRMASNNHLFNAKELKSMEKECFLRSGKQKIKAVGHFPPTPTDPYLRILFPRIALTGMKVLSVGLYLPGIHKPFQDVEFWLSDMTYHGQLEY